MNFIFYALNAIKVGILRKKTQVSFITYFSFSNSLLDLLVTKGYINFYKIEKIFVSRQKTFYMPAYKITIFFKFNNINFSVLRDIKIISNRNRKIYYTYYNLNSFVNKNYPVELLIMNDKGLFLSSDLNKLKKGGLVLCKLHC